MNGFLKWIYPDRCVVCDEILPASERDGFCSECFVKMETIEKPVCVKYGRVENNENALKNRMCLSYLAGDAKVGKIAAIFAYEGTARDAILRFKYNGRFDYAKAFAALLAKKRFEEYPKTDYVIIPVPMHKKKLRARGYNHAELLAKNVARLTNERFEPRVLIRGKNTLPQYGLNYEQRLINVSDAFSVKDNTAISGKSVLLIDDIYTTGATLEACAGALLSAGARNISGLCLSTTERI